ncbi:ABC transporter ATP-binding protein [Hominifimenecus sp. rT4P-3]|uniref:ABC transporter ATP-binding protein n=1 Tax=Hominifimenecus sp. rT4P-3 TaxID=3242979 RepID=UPI003DA61D7A
MNTTDRILEIESLTKIYGKGSTKTEALKGISFEVLEGEFLGIMGASGSGKTTLLNCIATMIKPSSGKVVLRGQDISGFRGAKLANYRGKEIGYLFQEFELLDNLTAEENISLPMALHGVTAKAAKADILKWASMLDIADVLDKFPAQMSGGQKQRVAAARALISNPEVVLADEPTGSLDSKNSKILMEKLAEVNRKQHKTILMVTHDANAASYCSRILFIQDGSVFHELRRSLEKENRAAFYERIVAVMAQLGGGSANVL